MAKSSINFQKAKPHSYNHNFRKSLPSYLLEKKDWEPNEYWQSQKTAKEIFGEELEKYGNKKGKRPTFANSHWEAVLNLNKNHTIEDVKKVAEHICKKFNIICTAIAVHRDEGHYKKDKEGKDFAIKNYHAHINFITVKDCKQNWRKELIKPQHLRELQTEIAEILGMERGLDKRLSKKERLEHKQYKQVAQEKESLEQEIKLLNLTKNEIKEAFEKIRQESKNRGFEADYFRELNTLKKETLEKTITREELEKITQNFIAKHTTTTTQKKLFGLLREEEVTETDYEAVAVEQQKALKQAVEIIKTQEQEKQAINTALEKYLIDGYELADDLRIKLEQKRAKERDYALEEIRTYQKHAESEAWAITAYKKILKGKEEMLTEQIKNLEKEREDLRKREKEAQQKRNSYISQLRNLARKGAAKVFMELLDFTNQRLTKLKVLLNVEDQKKKKNFRENFKTLIDAITEKTEILHNKNAELEKQNKHQNEKIQELEAKLERLSEAKQTQLNQLEQKIQELELKLEEAQKRSYKPQTTQTSSYPKQSFLKP